MTRRRIIISFILFLGLFDFCAIATEYKYPDYADEFLGVDKHETYNRKMFDFNYGLNKFLIKPIHIVWASVMPQYGMDRLLGISYNTEYPVRLVSSLVQRDFKNAGNETIRFFVNTTVGIGGMFDPAKRFLKLEPTHENMEKALARCKVKSGPYFVAPIINFTTPRNLTGRVLDMALTPTTYIGNPIMAAIKAVLTINKTSYLQSIIKLIETNFADPYHVTKVAYGIDGYIKTNNFDRLSVQSELKLENDENHSIYTKNGDTKLGVSAKISIGEITEKPKKNTKSKKQKINYSKISIEPDIYLKDYSPQSPVVDSMRTMLFELPEVKKSMWNELSVWNRSFAKNLKLSSVNVFSGRKNYNFKYILQKNKKAPIAVLYPSTGDGINSSHPTMFAKLFYDAGYSVIIQGNPFQWEFVESMPDDYSPGLPYKDAKMMRLTTAKIINKLQKKYGLQISGTVIFGTSLSGIDVLYMAQQESEENTLGNTDYIAICPPLDLIYSLDVLDGFAKETIDYEEYKEEIKQKVAFASAKLVRLYESKKDMDSNVNYMPFSEEEAKLFTSFVMREKLANVIFTLEKAPVNKKSDIYELINNMGFNDYFIRYIVGDSNIITQEIEQSLKINGISDYLETANNYKIYHSMNDYFINTQQLKELRYLSGKRLAIIDNGSHMGFLYKPEFIIDLKRTISELLLEKTLM